MMKSDFLRMRKLYLKPNAIKAYLKPCLCGSRSYNIDNTNGWTCKTITCSKCGRSISGDFIEKAVLQWNREYSAIHPDGFVDESALHTAK